MRYITTFAALAALSISSIATAGAQRGATTPPPAGGAPARGGAGRARPQRPQAIPTPKMLDSATPASVRRLLSVIADDSMEGRKVWSKGSDRAAAYIASEMKKIGLLPGGDSGYFQRIPGAAGAGTMIRRLAKMSDLDTVPADRRRLAVNVVGILPGNSSARTDTGTHADSIILIDAHYDHLGIGRPDSVTKDSIFNGADDDASGTVAVLEIARIMKTWPTPNRTIVFLATTGEESGLVGTGWYLANPVRPLSSMAANMEIEMIGRADTTAVGRGHAWLTGYQLSSMGETFHKSGLAVVPDPRPSEGFFSRSDNRAFAAAGIPAHTLSTFNLHTDYHHVGDDISKVDFVHMASVINIGARATWILTNGPAPTWNSGGRPCPALPAVPGGGRGAGRGGPPPIDTTGMTDRQKMLLATEFPQSCR